MSRVAMSKYKEGCKLITNFFGVKCHILNQKHFYYDVLTKSRGLNYILYIKYYNGDVHTEFGLKEHKGFLYSNNVKIKLGVLIDLDTNDAWFKDVESFEFFERAILELLEEKSIKGGYVHA